MIIYIGGYGRSGSTLLDIILGGHPRVASLGEVANLLRVYLKGGSGCSCGECLDGCPVWSAVISKVVARGDRAGIDVRGLYRVQCMVERWYGLPNLFWAGVRRGIRERYCLAVGGVLGAARELTECDVVVDSSKTAYDYAWRPLAIRWLCGLDVRLVHVVRSGPEVLKSKLAGDNRLMRRGIVERQRLAWLRATVGWNVANLCCLVLGVLFPPNHYTIVDYRDLVERPFESLARLGSFLGIDLSGVCEQLLGANGIRVGHLVAGNRIALAPRVRLERSVGGGQGVSRVLVLFFYVVSWPVLGLILIRKAWLTRREKKGCTGIPRG